MRLATWNINGMRARLDFIKLWLQDRQPDVVGFQELKMTDDVFPHEELKELGYHAVSHGQKAWNGVAVIARDAQPEVLQVGLPNQGDLGSRLLSTRVGDLTFITVYCPNGKSIAHEDFRQKLAWFDSLLGFLDDNHSPDEDLVLCGDFNIVPDAIDSWNEEGLKGKIFHTPEERHKYQSLLSWGLADLYREYAPEDPGFSWWDYRGGAFHRKRGLRIDALLATPPVREKMIAAKSDRDWRKKHDGMTASDHAPVWADFHAD